MKKRLMCFAFEELPALATVTAELGPVQSREYENDLLLTTY